MAQRLLQCGTNSDIFEKCSHSTRQLWSIYRHAMSCMSAFGSNDEDTEPFHVWSRQMAMRQSQRFHCLFCAVAPWNTAWQC